MYGLAPTNGKVTIIISQVQNGWVVTATRESEVETFVATDLNNALKMVADQYSIGHLPK